MQLGCRCGFVRGVWIDEPGEYIQQTTAAGGNVVVNTQQHPVGIREHCQRTTNLVETFLDSLGDADLAFARQQLDGSHLAHVHADGICRPAKFAVHGGESGSRFSGIVFVGRNRVVRQQQSFGIRHFLVHGDTHIVDHVDNIFDMFGIDDVIRQMIVDFAVGQVALLLAAGNQLLQL